MVKFMSKDKRKRRWFQFSLRMLFVVIAVLAVLFGWFGNRMRYVKKQRRAVEVIRNTGMRVLYDYQKGHRFRETKGFDTAEPRGPASYRKYSLGMTSFRMWFGFGVIRLTVSD